jgi:hypothetical protein
MDEEQLHLIANLAFNILKNNMKVEDLDKYDESIRTEVNNVLSNKVASENYNRVCYILQKLIEKEAIDRSSSFDLKEFFDRKDFDYQFPYECYFNRRTHKAAIGLIFEDKAFYCDVPLYSNHGSMATQYFRLDDPNFEELSIYNLLHPDDPRDWQDVIMEEKKAIVIHFMPNEYGAAFFIPDNINEFQQEELTRINSLLESKKIVSETNIDSKPLSQYLDSLQEKEIHYR